MVFYIKRLWKTCQLKKLNDLKYISFSKNALLYFFYDKLWINVVYQKKAKKILVIDTFDSYFVIKKTNI